MTLQQTLAKLLSRRDKLSSQQCTDELDKIDGRLAEIDARSLLIDRNFGGAPGPLLKAALETGTPDQVLALRREAELLEAERASIEAQREALEERRQQAISEEAVPTCRASLKKLPAAVTRLEALAREAIEARAELELLTEVFSSARKVALDGGQEPPAMEKALFDRLMRATGRNVEANLAIVEAWTGAPAPHVAELRRLDELRYEKDEAGRKAHAQREAQRLKGDAA